MTYHIQKLQEAITYAKQVTTEADGLAYDAALTEIEKNYLPLDMLPDVEELAHIIDPEAFGLPNNEEKNTITDRDAAKDKARLIIARLMNALNEVRG